MLSFDYKHYVPIIKGKLGEFKAIYKLDEEVKKSITPLIEVPPIPWNYEEDVTAKNIDEHLKNFIPNIKKYWNSDYPLFLDMNLIPYSERMRNGMHPLVNIFDQARENNLQAIPVTGITRDEEYQEAIKDIVKKDKRGLCIRIETSEIEIEEIDVALEDFLSGLSVNKSQVHLLIDLKEIQNSQSGLLVRSVRDLIKSLPDAKEWATLTLSATAFPQTMGGFESNSVSLTNRVEWQLWTSLYHRIDKIPRMPTFSDYTIVHPELLDIDPRIMQLGAKIKYTYDNDWIIVKGTSIKRGGSDQTIDLCRQLINLSEYSGPEFSWGDSYINECANEKDGPGNQTTWVTVGVNHHITFVVRQLTNYLVS